MPDAANITFGPLASIRGMEGSLTRGIYPSVFTLYCLPTDNLDSIGTLSFSDGSNTISLSNCAIGGAFIRKPYDGKWPSQAIHVLDRRWKWRFSNVSGDWNRRLSDGTVDTATG